MEGVKVDPTLLTKSKDPRLAKAHAMAVAAAAAAAASTAVSSNSNAQPLGEPAATTVDTGHSETLITMLKKQFLIQAKNAVEKESLGGGGGTSLATAAAPPSVAATNEDSEQQHNAPDKRRSSSEATTSRKRRSVSHSRRSPSLNSGRRSSRRRSPTPKSRRGHYRDYSPERRRYYDENGGRRNRRSHHNRGRRSSSRDRWGGGGGRDRYRDTRDYSSSLSLSRSVSPPGNRGGIGGKKNRWSPQKNKGPTHQMGNRPPAMPVMMGQGGGPPPHQYGVMAHPDPQAMYADPAYGPPPGAPYPYGVPPPQQAPFVTNTYGMPTQPPEFNANYPPPGNWTVDAYGQQQWIPAQMAPPQQAPFVTNTYGMPTQPPEFNANYPPPGNWTVDAYGQQQWIPAQMAPPQQPTQQPPPMLVPPPAMVNLNHPHHRGMMVAAGGRKKLEPATAPTQDAVAQEAENQRTEFKKQRKGYVKKTLLLRRELQTLKDQRKDMNVGNVPLSPTTKGFMDENEKLQNQIQAKLSTIENVIDMLSGLIGDKNASTDESDNKNLNSKTNMNIAQKMDDSGGEGNDAGRKTDYKSAHVQQRPKDRISERDPRVSRRGSDGRNDDHQTQHKTTNAERKGNEEAKAKEKTALTDRQGEMAESRDTHPHSGSGHTRPRKHKSKKESGASSSPSPAKGSKEEIDHGSSTRRRRRRRQRSSTSSGGRDDDDYDVRSSSAESSNSCSTEEEHSVRKSPQVKRTNVKKTIPPTTTKEDKIVPNNGDSRDHHRGESKKSALRDTGTTMRKEEARSKHGVAKPVASPATEPGEHQTEFQQSIEEDNNDDDDESSAERLKKKVIESMKRKQKEQAKAKTEEKRLTAVGGKEEKKERFNHVFYDPEMHWCQACDIFPKTAREYLTHLHTKEHLNRVEMETPWHMEMTIDQFPTYENAPTKRTPIRGLMFFVPATAWYCKLCSVWMGDLHCASSHLKSPQHANLYNVFLEENPDYEVNWLADRQQVLNSTKCAPLPPQITSVSTTAATDKKVKSKDDEKVSKKRKRKSEKKQKKRKKRSSKKQKKKSTATVNGSSDGNDGSSSSSDSNSSSAEENDEEAHKKQVNVKETSEARTNTEQQQQQQPQQSQQPQHPQPESICKKGLSTSIEKKIEYVEVKPSTMCPPPPVALSASVENTIALVPKTNVSRVVSEQANITVSKEKGHSSRDVAASKVAANTFHDREAGRGSISNTKNSGQREGASVVANAAVDQNSSMNSSTNSGPGGPSPDKKEGKMHVKIIPASAFSEANCSVSDTTATGSTNNSSSTVPHRNPFNQCPDLDKENRNKNKDHREKYEKDSSKMSKGKGKEKETDSRKQRDRERDRERDRDDRSGGGRIKDKKRTKTDRDRGRDKDRGDNDRRSTRYHSRSVSSTRSRSRSRGPQNFRRFKRSNSRNRGQKSPRAWGVRRQRLQAAHSRSRTPRRRSRSPYDRRRRTSRSKTRSRSRSYTRSPTRSASRTSSRARTRSHSKVHSRSRTRSQSQTRSPRVEKAVVKQSEFRPRVPEKDYKKTSNDARDKREKASKYPSKTTAAPTSSNDGYVSGGATKSSSSNNAPNSSCAANNAAASKKLPFIGKMPVFKKQATIPGSSSVGETNSTSLSAYSGIAVATPGYGGISGDKRVEDLQMQKPQASFSSMETSKGLHPPPPPPPPPRPPKITAAQIQMAMMEDAYGNGPPFHPDAPAMMADYDELMPDPLQFVNLMGQAPPPPPPSMLSMGAATSEGRAEAGGIPTVEGEADEENMLPPGIDEADSDEFVTTPMMMMMRSDMASAAAQKALPHDLQEALNIIFPSEEQKDTATTEENSHGPATATTTTTTTTAGNKQTAAAAASNNEGGGEARDIHKDDGNGEQKQTSDRHEEQSHVHDMSTLIIGRPHLDAKRKVAKSAGDTQIIQDEPVMQADELAKDGIHLITLSHHHLSQQQQPPTALLSSASSLTALGGSGIERGGIVLGPVPPPSPSTALSYSAPDTSIRFVMNTTTRKEKIKEMAPNSGPSKTDFDDNDDQEQEEKEKEKDAKEKKLKKSSSFSSVVSSMPQTADNSFVKEEQKPHYGIETAYTLPEEIPMPEETQSLGADTVSGLYTDVSDINLADIPKPPPSPTESEKRRRQEQLEELAMLGIDADDLAAQCF